MSSIPPVNGSPVRRSNLSEHVLYQRDADGDALAAFCDDPQNFNEDGLVDDNDPAELARMAVDWAANAPASAGRNPFLR